MYANYIKRFCCSRGARCLNQIKYSKWTSVFYFSNSTQDEKCHWKVGNVSECEPGAPTLQPSEPHNMRMFCSNLFINFFARCFSTLLLALSGTIIKGLPLFVQKLSWGDKDVSERGACARARVRDGKATRKKRLAAAPNRVSTLPTCDSYLI